MQAFQEVVYACLAKNPAERPTAAQLLQMRFFKVTRVQLFTVAFPLLVRLQTDLQLCVVYSTPPAPAAYSRGLAV